MVSKIDRNYTKDDDLFKLFFLTLSSIWPNRYGQMILVTKQ